MIYKSVFVDNLNAPFENNKSLFDNLHFIDLALQCLLLRCHCGSQRLHSGLKPILNSRRGTVLSAPQLLERDGVDAVPL